jgi:hypothetical protein
MVEMLTHGYWTLPDQRAQFWDSESWDSAASGFWGTWSDPCNKYIFVAPQKVKHMASLRQQLRKCKLSEASLNTSWVETPIIYHVHCQQVLPLTSAPAQPTANLQLCCTSQKLEFRLTTHLRVGWPGPLSIKSHSTLHSYARFAESRMILIIPRDPFRSWPISGVTGWGYCIVGASTTYRRGTKILKNRWSSLSSPCTTSSYGSELGNS